MAHYLLFKRSARHSTHNTNKSTKMSINTEAKIKPYVLNTKVFRAFNDQPGKERKNRIRKTSTNSHVSPVSSTNAIWLRVNWNFCSEVQGSSSRKLSCVRKIWQPLVPKITVQGRSSEGRRRVTKLFIAWCL